MIVSLFKRFGKAYLKFLVFVFGCWFFLAYVLDEATTPFGGIDLYIIWGLASLIVGIYLLGGAVGEVENLVKILMMIIMLLVGYTMTGVVASRWGFDGTAYAGEIQLQTTQVAFLIGFFLELPAVFISRESTNSIGIIKRKLASVMFVGVIIYIFHDPISDILDIYSNEVFRRAVIDSTVVVLTLFSIEAAFAIEEEVIKWIRVIIPFIFFLILLIFLSSAINTPF